MPGSPIPDVSRGQRGGDVVVVDELKADAGVGQDRPQRGGSGRVPSEPAPAASARGPGAGPCRGEGSLRARRDTGAEDVGLGLRFGDGVLELGLDLRLVGRVGMAPGAAGGLLLGDQLGKAAVKAVGRDR